jgi:hypothetical protein
MVRDEPRKAMDSEEPAKPHEIASEEHLLQKCKPF